METTPTDTLEMIGRVVKGELPKDYKMVDLAYRPEGSGSGPIGWSFIIQVKTLGIVGGLNEYRIGYCYANAPTEEKVKADVHDMMGRIGVMRAGRSLN